MTKRYYWLKLDEKFFEDDTIEWIEEQENGKDYVIFYLKLCLKSLKDEGKLIRYVGERLIPYDVKALAKLTNTPPDTVAVAMKLFLEIGLVSNLESGEIYLNQINEMIGTETDIAKRVRKHRTKQEALGHKPDSLQSNKSSLQSNTPETKCNTEIEKEIDIEYSAFFEEVWKLYPNKKGKGKISKTKKKEIYKLGDEFKRCIERYKEYVENLKILGFKDLMYQNASTFFNSGYVDYLDINYEEKEKPPQRKLKLVIRDDVL